MRRGRGEDGVTLIELLMAIAIMGVIAVPLTTSLIVGLRTTNQANAQLTDANAVALLPIYLAPDLQKIDQAHAGGPIEFNVADCRGVGSSADVVFHEVDTGSGATDTSYSLEPTGATKRLVRRDGSTGCHRQIIAPGLKSDYTLADGGNLRTNCVDLVTTCDGVHANLKRVQITLITPTLYQVTYGATTRS